MSLRFTLVLLLFTQIAFAQEKINKGFKTFKVYPAKRLQLNINDSFSFSAQVVKGDQLVFEYYYKADEYADMTDDEYTEKILFAVPKGTGSFLLRDSTLRAAYLRSCFCVDRGWHRIKDGYISGKKLNSKTWAVEVSINTEKEPDRSTGPIAVDVVGKFILQPMPKVIKKPVRKPVCKPVPVKKKSAQMILKKK